MIRSFLSVMLLCIAIVSVNACEICGCGNNNFQIGILPTFNKGFLGLRYSSSKFASRLSTDASQYSHDYYKVTELWGGYNFKRLQVMAFVPYLFNRKESDDGTSSFNGLGDLMILVNYNVLRASSLSKDETTTIRNEIYVGGGIKLPTGANRVDVSNQDFNVGDFNSLPGTGSVDYLINLTHNFMWNRSGVVTNLAYRINGTNHQDYKFGNRAYINSAYYYTLTAKTVKIKPSVGVNYQHNVVNTYAGSEVENSNGYNLNATAGVNLLYGKIGFNATVFIPVKQDMYAGQTNLSLRSSVGLTYSL